METYELDADERRLRQIEHVRATLAPVPDRHHPAPWRIPGTTEKGFMIVDARGAYVCNVLSSEAAEAIVLAVNTFAGVAE